MDESTILSLQRSSSLVVSELRGALNSDSADDCRQAVAQALRSAKELSKMIGALQPADPSEDILFLKTRIAQLEHRAALEHPNEADQGLPYAPLRSSALEALQFKLTRMEEHSLSLAPISADGGALLAASERAVASLAQLVQLCGAGQRARRSDADEALRHFKGFRVSALRFCRLLTDAGHGERVAASVELLEPSVSAFCATVRESSVSPSAGTESRLQSARDHVYRQVASCLRQLETIDNHADY